MALIGDVPVIYVEGYTSTVARPGGGWGGRLNDYDLIEVLDLNDTSSKDPLDLSYKQALDPKGTELYVGAPSNGLDLSGSCDGGRDGGEEDESFPSLEALLLGSGGAQESQQLGSRLRGDKGAHTDNSSVHSGSDGSTSEQGERHYSLSTPSTSVASSEAGCCILYEKTENSIFDPPPLSDYTLSLTRDTQTCFKNTEPRHFGGKEKKGQGASCSTDNIIPYSLQSPVRMWSPTQFTGATDIRNPSKRKAGSAGLDEGGESGHRLEKVRRTDPIIIDETDGTADDLNEVEFARIRSQSKPVFRRPPSPRTFQQLEKTISLSRSSEVGNSQDDPLVVEDDEEKTGESGGSIRTTSTESEIDTVCLRSSHPREHPNMDGCLSPPTTEPTTSPFDRPISPSVALSCDPVEQAISGGDCGAVATAHPPHAITVPPPLPEQYQDQGRSALDEEEWEIARIVDKRQTEKGYEYQVCWKRTWLREYELRNAQELLRGFEAKRQAQRGRKRGRPACADRGR